MSLAKQRQRAAFRRAVFERDDYVCRLCGRGSPGVELEAHHITSRDDMPRGGYVVENGVTVCLPCHRQCEAGEPDAATLYALVGSSYATALAAAERDR